MSDTTAITITSRAGYELVDAKLRTQYEQMLAEISARLSPDHAFIFARPEQSLGGDGDQTAWFVDGVGEPIMLADLPPDRKDAVEQRLAQIERDLRALAVDLKSAGPASADAGRLIEKALERPAGEPVWAVDDRPVLVNWGMRPKGDRTSAQVASGLVTNAGSPIVTATAMPAAAPPSQASGGSPRRPAGLQLQRSFGPLLWIMFTALLLTSGYLLLPACGIAVPAWAPLLGRLLPNWCRMAGADTLGDLRLEISQMQGEIEGDQRALIVKAANCPASCPVQRERTEVQPTPPTPPVSDEACSPVDLPPTAHRGELELDLKWAGITDLDLSVVCPDGAQVSYTSKIGCGAKFDIDVNAGSSSVASPVEHIIWTDVSQAPPGRYTVIVTPYAKKSSTSARIPFDVYLTFRGQGVDHKTGIATRFGSGEKLRMFTFELPLAGRRSEDAPMTEGRTPSGQTCRIGGAGGASSAGPSGPATGPKP